MNIKARARRGPHETGFLLQAIQVRVVDGFHLHRLTGSSRRFIPDRKLQWEKKFAGYGSFVLSTQVLYHPALLSLSRDFSWFLMIPHSYHKCCRLKCQCPQWFQPRRYRKSRNIFKWNHLLSTDHPLIVHWSPQCHPDLPKSCPILVIQWDDLFKDVAVNTQEIVVSWNLQRICQRDLL